MKTRWVTVITILFICIGFAADGISAEVCQGKCLQYSVNPAQVTIEEYDTNFSQDMPYGNPTGVITRFDLSKAKIGIVPEPGDILRIAYTVEGNKNIALKVMNVSKQDIMRK